MVKFQVRVREFSRDGNFRTFDSLENGHVFIIELKNSNPIINIIEKFYSDGIKQTDFLYLNNF